MGFGLKANAQNFLRRRYVKAWQYGAAEIDTKMFADAFRIRS